MDKERYDRAVRSYYRSELNSCLLLLSWSLTSIFGSCLLLCYSAKYLVQGFAFSAILLGIIQLLVGSIMLFKYQKRKGFRNNPIDEENLKEEIRLVQKGVSNFKKSSTLESLLFFLGFVFMMIGAFGEGGGYMAGSGAGICLQSGVTMGFNLFALLRIRLYEHELRKMAI